VVQGIAVQQLVAGRQSVAAGNRTLAQISDPNGPELTTLHAEAQATRDDILHATAAP
jgi:hypothetical protein